MFVSNMSYYIRSLNLSRDELFKELKLNVDKTIDFFNCSYLTDIYCFTDNQDKKKKFIEDNTNSLLYLGYERLFSIYSNLQLLYVVDDLSINKQKYKEIMEDKIFDLDEFINYVHNLSFDYKSKIKSYVDYSKISLAQVAENSEHQMMLNEYTKNISDQETLFFNQKINLYKNLINKYILFLTKINLIIKNIK